jgi:hypothetical protein
VIGVDSVTLSIPYLIELVKTRYPHFKVKVGVFANVDTARKAVFFENLGADCIALQPLVINRNFSRLKSVREAVKCELQLIANSNCLLECPMTPYHNVGLSHASQPASKGFFIDYCLLRCLTTKLSDPVNYMKSPWIRPEDLHYYEAVGDFSLKILERDAPTATLVRRAQAYHDRHYNGNLLDIVQSYGFKEARSSGQPKRPWHWELREFLKPLTFRPLKLLPLRELAKLQGMLYSSARSEDRLSIDNSALDGFIDKFVERDCVNTECEDCQHCHAYADRALTVDTKFRQDCLDITDRLLGDLKSGQMWGRSAEPRWRDAQ